MLANRKLILAHFWFAFAVFGVALTLAVAVLAADRVASVRAAVEAGYRPPEGAALEVMIEKTGRGTAAELG